MLNMSTQPDPMAYMIETLLAGPLAIDVLVGAEKRTVRAMEGSQHDDAFGLVAGYKKWIEVSPSEQIDVSDAVEIGGEEFRVSVDPFFAKGAKIVPLERVV